LMAPQVLRRLAADLYRCEGATGFGPRDRLVRLLLRVPNRPAKSSIRDRAWIAKTPSRRLRLLAHTVENRSQRLPGPERRCPEAPSGTSRFDRAKTIFRPARPHPMIADGGHSTESRRDVDDSSNVGRRLRIALDGVRSGRG